MRLIPLLLLLMGCTSLEKAQSIDCRVRAEQCVLVEHECTGSRDQSEREVTK